MAELLEVDPERQLRSTLADSDADMSEPETLSRRCPECGGEMELDRYEGWDREKGWRQIERLRCISVVLKRAFRADTKGCRRVEILSELSIEGRPPPV